MKNLVTQPVMLRDIADRIETQQHVQGSDPIPIPAVRAIMEDFAAHLQDLDADRRRALLYLMVVKITLTQGKGVRSIHLHLTDSVANALGMAIMPPLPAAPKTACAPAS